ncbi:MULTISPECIES: FMN-dependent NADH-azoreductase [Kitasatospora]|uniref:FMN dependent NADH:quinone oxidoreductase n=1 Tax=Kitasatospora cystarginea TaxID=58350 RepID=A0ABN3F189_9ACTN
MATLLHLDSSALSHGSASREVTATFRKAWEEQHPEGKVVYRDLAAEPLPHLSAAGITAAFTDPADHTEEQKAALALRTELVEELEAADAVLIGAPMYNFTIPSSLKAWLDQVIIMGRTGGENSTVAGKPVTVVASRGGAYGPGTPREGFEFAANYLEKVLSGLLGLEVVDVIVPELTLARTVPAMADLVGAADASRAQAHEAAAAKAKELAARLSA